MSVFREIKLSENESGGVNFGLDGARWSAAQDLADALPFPLKAEGSLTHEEVEAMMGHANDLKKQKGYWQKYSKNAISAVESFTEVRKSQTDLVTAVSEARSKIAKLEKAMGIALSESDAQVRTASAEHRAAIAESDLASGLKLQQIGTTHAHSLAYLQRQHQLEMEQIQSREQSRGESLVERYQRLRESSQREIFAPMSPSVSSLDKAKSNRIGQSWLKRILFG